ncbi:hypothetical protein KI387_010254, partial [Taxus chinensis]
SREVTHFQPARLTRPTRPDLLSAHACEVVNPNPCLANRLPRPGSILEPWIAPRALPCADGVCPSWGRRSLCEHGDAPPLYSPPLKVATPTAPMLDFASLRKGCKCSQHLDK